MAAIICEDSHLCFAPIPEPAHRTSHLCFGKRYHPNLLPIEVAAVTSVFSDAVDELATLGKTLPVDKNAEWSEEFRDLSERFGNPPRSPKKYPEMAGLWPSATEAMLKVQRDRLFAEKVLDSTMRELLEKGSFASLRASLDWQCAMQADERELLSRFQADQESVAELAKQLNNDVVEQAAFWGKKHELLTSNFHDAHLTAGLTMEYARRWESTRRAQHGVLLGREEELLQDAMRCLSGPHEERVHFEIMRFLAKETEVLKKELDHWTDLYDEEMTQRETELMRMRSNREHQSEQHRELAVELRRREDVIAETAVLRLENEEKQRSLANIVAIQAWWRGVSFRAGILKEKSGKKQSKKGIKKKGKKPRRPKLT